MSSESSESQAASTPAADSVTDDSTENLNTDNESLKSSQPKSDSPPDDAQTAESSTPAEPVASQSTSTSSSGSPKPVLIGSQRDPANPTLVPSKPKAVREAAESPAIVPAVSTVEDSTAEEVERPEDSQSDVEQVGAEDPEPVSIELPPPLILSDDLEKELDEALGDVSIEDLMSEKDHEATTVEVEIDGRYKATVTKIHGDDVFYNLRGHHEGVASAKQFKTLPKVGSQMDVVVTGYHTDDGIYELHIPGASVSVSDWADLDEGTVVEAKITGANTGGLECLVGNIRGFIPASQIEIYRVENLSEYINQKLQCIVTEANPRRRNLVLSHRAIAEREREANRQQILDQLEPGQSRDGTVSKLMDFGAFVDLGGVDGLVHISKMSWDRVEHPSEVFQVGQAVKVKIEKVDKQSGKISLSYRDLQEHPWDSVPGKYLASSVVTGVVSRIANFGAFVKLEPGIEGLIHISELAHHRVFAVANIVKEGDEVEVKILSVDAENQRIGLSLKATQAAPVREEKKVETEAGDDEPPRELAVPKHKGPLKGGRDKPSGGDQFGLKW
jgi:small subunit ribosomal protein S1